MRRKKRKLGSVGGMRRGIKEESRGSIVSFLKN
jgi:hypothetical protein